MYEILEKARLVSKDRKHCLSEGWGMAAKGQVNIWGCRKWSVYLNRGFPGGASGKEPACQCRRYKRHEFNPWVGKIPWRKKWQHTPVFLSGKPYGQRKLVHYSPWDHKESDTTKQLTQYYYSWFGLPWWLSRKESTCSAEAAGGIGSVPGLGRFPGGENMATHSSVLAWRIPMDWGAWWATVHGIAKSWTWQAT